MKLYRAIKNIKSKNRDSQYSYYLSKGSFFLIPAIWIGLFLAMTQSLSALTQDEAEKVARLSYEQPRGKSSELECEMVITQSSGYTEERKLTIYRQDWEKRYQNLVKFSHPNDISGTGFLTWSYPTKEDVQWIYLPALKKVRKISLKTKHNSFVGTDFSYDDMRERKFDEDEYSYLKEGQMGDSPCHIIKATPKKSSESEYESMELYIRKDNNYLVGVRYFKKGKLYKLFLANDLRLIDGIWVAYKNEMKNLESRSKTQISVNEAKINKGLGDDIFTERNLAK